MSLFEHYIGIDYSGAEVASSSLKGLRVFEASAASEPKEVMPPPSPRRYWSRKEIAEWLREQLSGDDPTIVGIDHAFSFPLNYFKKHALPLDWPAFLEHFQRHCPTGRDNMYVDFVRDGLHGSWKDCCGHSSWLRITEEWTVSARSVFQFDVQGAVAKSSYAGIPWLLYLRQHCDGKVHFWPFDGWDLPAGKSVVAEVYPSLWMRRFPRRDRDGDQHAAYSVAAWLRRTDLNGSLASVFFHPPLEPRERKVALIEGWILGVV
jgi:hypothetical protein